MKWEFEEELKKYGYSKECIDQVDSISEGIILEIGRTLKPDKEACFNRLERYRICLEALYELNAKKKEIEKTDEVVPEPSVLIRCLNKIRNIIMDERKWERKMNEEVEQIKQKHPLVFPIIVSILTSILLGLLTNCIWEGIQQSETEISIRKMQQELDSLISDQTNMHLIIDPDEPDRFKVYIYMTKI